MRAAQVVDAVLLLDEDCQLDAIGIKKEPGGSMEVRRRRF